MTLDAGDPAPSVTAQNQGGETLALDFADTSPLLLPAERHARVYGRGAAVHRGAADSPRGRRRRLRRLDGHGRVTRGLRGRVRPRGRPAGQRPRSV